jgi:hypothetical protein
MDVNVIKEYDVVISTDADDLIKEVNRKLKDNWQPMGNLVVDDNGFYQSMVKIVMPDPEDL